MPQNIASYELQYIAIWPVVRFVVVVSLFLSILFSIFVLTFITVIMGGLSLLWQELGVIPVDPPGLAAGLPGFLVIVLLCTIAQTAILTVATAILVILYNLMAGLLGGIRLRLRALPDLTPASISQVPVPQPSPASPESSGASPSITHE